MIRETSQPPSISQRENKHAVHEHLNPQRCRTCPRHPLLPYPTKSTKEMGQLSWEVGRGWADSNQDSELSGDCRGVADSIRKTAYELFGTPLLWRAQPALWATARVPDPFLPRGWLPEQAFVAELWTHAEKPAQPCRTGRKHRSWSISGNCPGNPSGRLLTLDLALPSWEEYILFRIPPCKREQEMWKWAHP